MVQVFLGQIVHTKSLNEIEIFVKGFVAVDANGKINGVGADYANWREQQQNLNVEEVQLTPHQFLMPGFVDCHIHAPQVALVGLGYDMPLLEWLHTYTFPCEAKYDNQDYASTVYANVVQSTINCGTTLASYFGTNNKDSTVLLAKEVLRQGQRALIGKVCSNCNSPDYYVESTDQANAGTIAFVKEVLELNSPLVKPSITPRFAISCNGELMELLADIARKHNLHIQSHISESIAEIDFAKSIYSTSYAKIYDNAGLLTNKTIMAHAVHLEDEEIDLFKERGTSIAHCPASNTCLSSGLCDIQRFIKKGVKVGLGTDVSGGNSLSMMNAMLRALDVSHHLEFIKKQDIKGTGCMPTQDLDYKPINYKQALYLATLGGAEALALGDVTGNFTVGKDFDAILVDASSYPVQNFNNCNSQNTPKISPQLHLLELLQRFIYVGDDRNIRKVFVAGKQIK